MKKKISSILVICLLISTLLAYPVVAGELALESPSVVLMDASSGKILYEENSHERRAPASVTKLMTLLVATEAIKNGKGSYQDVVVTSEHAASLGGSQIYLAPSEEMLLQDMLVAIAVGSANDACVAVAEHLYGSQEGFVQAMNEKAKAVGLKDTQFINPYGLPEDGHYTSAYDLALISQEALKHEEILQLTSIKHYTLRGDTSKPFELNNTNKLLWWYPGADGFKTGWIGTESGYCLASTAEKNGLRLIAVVLGAQERKGNFRDSMDLFNYGFANYQYKEFYQPGQEIQMIPIGKGTKEGIKAGCETSIGITLPKGNIEGLDTIVQYPANLTAPIAQGQPIGKVSIVKGNETLEEFNVIALEAVERESFIACVNKVIACVFGN